MAFMVRKSLKVNQEHTTDQVANGASFDAPHPEQGKKTISTSAKPPEKKARLSCDIAKPLHRRLRMAAVKNDTTIVAIIEKLIEKGIDP